jgi:thiol-disulfide isomerase/thioredoxin
MLLLALIIISAAISLAGCGPDSESSEDNTATGTDSGNDLPQMPIFSLEKLGGGEISHEDLLGKPTVINFGASWCGPCEFEAPSFAKAHTDYPDVGFVGIAVKDSEEAQQQFVDKFGWTFPIGMDFTGTVVTDFQREALMPRGAIPTTFFVDSVGNIVDVFIGPVSEADLEERIKALQAADAVNAADSNTATDTVTESGPASP